MIKEAFIALCVATCACAHSLHQSTAEAEYDAQTKKLEVSLTVFINDLELALIRHSERLMSLEKTPAAEFDAQIQCYLAKTFVIKDKAGKVVTLEWVGRSPDADSVKTGDPAVTLFFEVLLPHGLGDSTLQHAVFCDLYEDQINLLQLRSGDDKVEMSFKRGDTAKRTAP